MVIVAQDVPVAAPEKGRLRLMLRSVRAAILDAIADCGRGLDALANAQQADAIHDRQLVAAVRAAAMGGEEAHIRGCGCEQRFDLLRVLVVNAQVADANEDGWIARAGTRFGRGMSRMRVAVGGADRAAEGQVQ